MICLAIMQKACLNINSGLSPLEYHKLLKLWNSNNHSLSYMTICRIFILLGFLFFIIKTHSVFSLNTSKEAKNHMSTINLENPTDLRVLTLNVWALPKVSKEKDLRIQEVAKRLSSGEFDIVSLQEIWGEGDRTKVIDIAAEGGLKYSHYFRSGTIGSGILVLSRYPILKLSYHRFSINGKPYKIYHGDYFGGKGVGLAKIATPMGNVDFYLTHLIAQYHTDNDEYLAHRVIQAFELIEFVQATTSADLSIIVGDFNSTPDSLGYSMYRQIGQFEDAFYQVNPKKPGYTYSAENPYNTNLARVDFIESERIDYIFYQLANGKSWDLVDCRLIMQNIDSEVDGKPAAYSDHYGVFAQFSRNNLGRTNNKDASIENDYSETLLRVVDEIDNGINDAIQRRLSYRIVAAALGVALLAAWFVPVAQIFPELYLHFCFRLLSSLTLSILTIVFFSEFCLGFFYSPNEINALNEIREQILLLLSRL